MKKILGLFILFLSFFTFETIVNAEAFKEGSYISGAYISKKKNGVVHYLTVRYMEDNDGNIAYCIEPYVKFVDGQKYTSIEGDLSGYKDLTDAQKRKISLLAYFGYGYTNRTSSKWYVITQFLIWQTADTEGDIYFTDTLDGNKITKYTTEIEELLNDVEKYDIKPTFIKDYTLDLNEKLQINELNNDYEIVSSDFEYNNNLSNGYIVNKVNANGKVVFRKKSNFYNRNVVLFDSITSQDLIRPGNVINPSYTININVRKGDITLDITKDDSVYTVESDFSNTCYEVSDSSGSVVDKVCTGNDELVYKTLELPYGDYVIKQVSYGLGFKKDDKVYRTTINEKDEHPRVGLENILIRNTIEIVKYACKNDVCGYEANAEFELYDVLGNLVDTIKTNELGYASIVFGYGSYQVKQVKGANDYTLANPYQEKIVDETTEHKKTLFNYYVEPEVNEPEPEPIPEPEPEVDEIPEIEIEEPEETIILPPKTGVIGYEFEYILLGMTFAIKKIIKSI